MTTELANVNQATLPAFAKARQSSILEGMGGGLADSTPSISLSGSRFTFMKDGAELGKADTLHLDVVLVGASAHIHRTFFAGAYDPTRSDVKPDCTSHDGVTPDANSSKKQHDNCKFCPQNVKQADPRRPGKDHTPCNFSKEIAVMIPGDATATVWRLRLSSMTVFNQTVSSDANLMTWKSMFLKMNSMGADPVNHIIRLTFDSSASVPALLFSIVGQVGDGGRYDEAFYNQVTHAIDQGEPTKVVGDNALSPAEPAPVATQAAPTQAPVPPVQTAAPVQATQAPAPVATQAPAPAPVPTTTAPPVIPTETVDQGGVVDTAVETATDTAMSGGPEDVSNLLAMFK